MSGKKEFNPFDYQSGTSFRAILSHDYFALIEEMHQKVSSDMFSFALDVGNYFYRAVFAERVIMTAMVCASGLQRSERLSADENEIVQLCETANAEMAAMVRTESEKVLEKVLAEASNTMKNGYVRSDN